MRRVCQDRGLMAIPEGVDPPPPLNCATVSMCGRGALRTRQQFLRHIEVGTAATFEFMQARLRHRRLP